MQQVIGWAASVVLVLTIGYQVWQQWQAGSSKGVSIWLFLGQIAASTLFVIYSAMVADAVFVVTNAILLLSAITGLSIVIYHRKRNPDEGNATR